MEYLLRFLADNLSYGDYIKGIPNLSKSQMEVLFERLKAELDTTKIINNRPSTVNIADTKIESMSTAKIAVTDKPISNVECCVHCGSILIKKHGTTKGGVQRYICKDCGKSFSQNYGLITHYTHLAEWQWEEAVRAIVCGLSITELSKNIKVSTKTAWLCRMKIYSVLQAIFDQVDTFNNIVEVDGKYERISFKGLKDKSFFINKLGRLPRHHRNKAERISYLGNDYDKLFVSKPDFLNQMIHEKQTVLSGTDTIDENHQQVCILTAIDRSNNIYMKPVSAGTATSQIVSDTLKPIIAKDAVLVTDEHYSYRSYCNTENVYHISIPSKVRSVGAYSLARVNSLHSAMDRFFGCNQDKPATKYLDLYLTMFWWLQKNKQMSQNEQFEILYKIMTGCVEMSVRAKMTKVTLSMLASRQFSFDTRGYY